eukprot:SAG11_NODE_3916_length_2150_cov_1.076060_2_plen_268_part_00
MHSPCVNGACSRSEGLALCDCHDGYSGDNCDVDLDDCASTPCAFGAVCADAGAGYGYHCYCADGFLGPDCEQESDECGSSPCSCDAVCSDNLDQYTCTCPPGWTGETCSDAVDACASGPCMHGGACMTQLNQYTCDCVVKGGWGGENCESDINECYSSPCLNGASPPSPSCSHFSLFPIKTQPMDTYQLIFYPLKYQAVNVSRVLLTLAARRTASTHASVLQRGEAKTVNFSLISARVLLPWNRVLVDRLTSMAHATKSTSVRHCHA